MRKTLYCPRCKRNTGHYGEQQTPAVVRVFARLVTLGMLNTSTYDMYCPQCGDHNYTYEPFFHRFTWARKGTGVTVDRGLYSYDV